MADHEHDIDERIDVRIDKDAEPVGDVLDALAAMLVDRFQEEKNEQADERSADSRAGSDVP